MSFTWNWTLGNHSIFHHVHDSDVNLMMYGYWNLSKTSAFIEMTLLLFSIQSLWGIVWIDFQILHQFAFQDKMLLDHDMLSFLYIVGFDLLILYWEFLCQPGQCSSVDWASSHALGDQVVNSLVHVKYGDRYFQEISSIFMKWQLVFDFVSATSFLHVRTHY